jgi:hypothetical protein
MKLAPKAGLAHPIPLGLGANSAPGACPDPVGTSLYPACPEFRGEPRRARYPCPRFPLAARFARHSSRATRHFLLSTFRINTCKSVTKQTTLTTCRINTYAKTGGGGPPARSAFRHSYSPARHPQTSLFHTLADSCDSLWAFLHPPILCFQEVADSFRKMPGVWHPDPTFGLSVGVDEDSLYRRRIYGTPGWGVPTCQLSTVDRFCVFKRLQSLFAKCRGCGIPIRLLDSRGSRRRLPVPETNLRETRVGGYPAVDFQLSTVDRFCVILSPFRRAKNADAR